MIKRVLAIFSLSLLGVQGIAHAEGSVVNFYAQTATRPLQEKTDALHLQRGLFYHQQKSPEPALQELAYVLNHVPNHPTALELVGSLSLEQDRPAEAKTYYERALRLYPQEEQTYLLYGDFLQQLEELSAAIAHYEQGITHLPQSAELHNRLGDLYFDSGRYQEALEQAQAAASLTQLDPRLQDKLAQEGLWPETVL